MVYDNEKLRNVTYFTMLFLYLLDRESKQTNMRQKKTDEKTHLSFNFN